MNLDTQEITLEGNVKGSVTDDGTKSEQPKQAQKTEKKEEAVKSESGKTEEEKKETDKPESVKTEEKSEIKTEENQQTGESKDAHQPALLCEGGRPDCTGYEDREAVRKPYLRTEDSPPCFHADGQPDSREGEDSP